MQGVGKLVPGQVSVINTNLKRECTSQARTSNIKAATMIAGVVRTTLGPKSMLKMLLDPMGGIVMTNDGHAILREIDVMHPAAKSLLDISRAQDEEVGDGTTSVVILAGELLGLTEKFISKSPIHPVTIYKGFMSALGDMKSIIDRIAVDLDFSDKKNMIEMVQMSLDTKFTSRYGNQMAELALNAVNVVKDEYEGRVDIDIKRFVKIEKVPGGVFEDTAMLSGVMVNKDVTHAKMRRRIANPRVVLLDSTLEYKKGESQTNVEIMKETDFEALLAQEEEEVRRMCDSIIAVGCDVVVTEKGVCDLAQHFLVSAGITVLRRVRKTDNNRISRVTGSTIVNRLADLKPKHLGSCDLFEVIKIGDEYFSQFINDKNPKACTILLRGGSKDSLNEIERNLHDALAVAKNLALIPKVLPGGGASEMYISRMLHDLAPSKGMLQPVYECIAHAFEVIPRTLIDNAGGDVVRTLTELRAKHAKTNETGIYGIDGHKGTIVDVTSSNIWDSYRVKEQVINTAMECAATIVRIDDVLSGVNTGDKKVGAEVNQFDRPGGANDRVAD